MKKIRLFYEQHILPIVYDYSMSLSECVGKLVRVVNGLIEDVQVIDHKTDVAEQNIDVLQERVNTNNTLINNLRSEVEDLEDTVESLPSQDNIDQLNSAITQNSSDISDLDTRVTVLEGMNVYDRLDQVEQNIIDLQGDVSDIEDDIDNLNTDISIINTSITGIRNDITSINGSIGTILSDISLINDDISDVKSDISDIEDDIANINTNITSINGDITNMNSSIGSMSSDISSLMQDVSDINGDISNITSDIIGLRSDINNKSTVSYSQIVTTGTKIGEITIDGNTTDIYSPAASIPTAAQVSYNDVHSTGYTNVQDALSYGIDKADTAYQVALNNQSDIRIINTVLSTKIDAYYVDTYLAMIIKDFGLDVGDSFDIPIAELPFSGYLTGNSGQVYLSIPKTFNLLHDMDSGLYSFSISGKLRIRGVSGYCLNNVEISTLTNSITPYKEGLRVLLTLPSTASSATNTPVSCYFDVGSKISITLI